MDGTNPKVAVFVQPPVAIPQPPEVAGEAVSQDLAGESAWLLRFCVGYGFIMLVFLNYAAVLPLIQQEWGLTNRAAGMIFSAYQVGYICSATLLSYLTDRFQARSIFLLSAAWSVVANFLFALFAVDLTSALIYRALAGLGMGGTYVPGLKLVADRFPSVRRGRAVGFYTSAFVFGAAASMLLSGLVGSVAGWRLAIVTTATGTLVGTLLCRTVLQEDRAITAMDAGRRLRLEVLRNKPALLMIVAYAAHMWEQYGMRAWMAAFLAASFLQTGYSNAQGTGYGAGLAAVIVAAGGIATGLAGSLSDRMGRIRTASAIMLISAACSLGFGWLMGLSPAVLVLAGLVYSFFVVADSPVLSTGLTELVPPHSVGAAMGVQTLVGFLAATASPAIFGWVLDWTNSNPTGAEGGILLTWGWAFAILGLGALIGPAALAIVRRLPESAKMAAGKL